MTETYRKWNNFKKFMVDENKSELEKNRKLFEKLLDFYYEGKFNKPEGATEEKINNIENLINQVAKNLTQKDIEKICKKIFKKYTEF